MSLSSAKSVKQDVSCSNTLLLDSNSEFEFITNRSILEFESSSADELFSNGVILPIHTLQEKTTTTQKHTPYVKSPYTKLPPLPLKKETIRESLLDVSSDDGNKKPHSKSFWGFSRSKSLNCDTKKNLAFSLPFLSRSKSTGLVSNPKRVSSNKQPSSKSSSYYSCFSNLNLQKSPSGKSYGGSYGNGLRVSPVLNVPTPCVSSKGSANLFGFGSFLGVGKVKKSNK